MPEFARATRGRWTAGLTLCVACSPALAAGQCKLAKLAEFPVTMNQLSPEIVAKINGTDVRLIVDSGAFYSMIDYGSAVALRLRVRAAPIGFYSEAIGGRVTLSIASVNDFMLPGFTLHDVEFVVGGSYVGDQAVGVLGRDILQLADAEYDFAGGVARLMKAQDCGDTVLAYWARAGEPYSVINTVRSERGTTTRIPSKEGFRHPVVAVVYVNGLAVRAVFDTGASTSFLTIKAAAKAGIKIDSPGVVPGGYAMGFGQSTVETYIAPVSVFKIGDEEIHNTRLRLGNTELSDVDMLIGADFFLSHHIYVANSQDKLYFTYNGGPVFNLTGVPHTPEPLPGATPAADALMANPSAEAPKKSVENASEYARRGAALAARQEFDQALQDLNRACDLASDHADYFFQRGVLYERLEQSGPATADFDRAIQLEPRHVAALFARARNRLQSGDRSGAQADLDAANVALPIQGATRLDLAFQYARLEQFKKATEQYDLWITSHPEDARLPAALNGLCRARAFGDVELQRALVDCNAALKHAAKGSPFYAEVMGARGFVFLRMGDYDKSIADFDASLKVIPKDASFLYCRGIDKLRKQKTSEGQADIAQARAISSEVADNFSRYGISP